MALLRKGSRGNAVRDLQRQLNSRGHNSGTVDGIFGNKTYNAVRAFQRASGLVVDGIVGPATKGKLQSGGTTRELQTIINQLGINVGKIDGIMGANTGKGIREFQSIFGLAVDGIAGKNTWAVLNKAKGVKHFKISEFKCKHCGKVKLDINLLVKLEELRKKTGPLVINSGYRCPTHNRNVGGAPNSQHVKGTAADVRGTRMSANNVYAHANKIFNNGGVGRYNTFTHVDVRNGKARW